MWESVFSGGMAIIIQGDVSWNDQKQLFQILVWSYRFLATLFQRISILAMVGLKTRQTRMHEENACNLKTDR